MHLPEYTLKQVIGIYEMAHERLMQHRIQCDTCNLLTDEKQMDGWCGEGVAAARAVAKWKRRIKAAAKREGVTMTV